MPASIFITYATRYGSTQEVAEAIAAELRDCGLKVDLQPIRKVQSLEGYGMVVLGAPLYISHWLKEAHRFLSQHRQALMQRPVAIFSLGPVVDVEAQWRVVRAQLAKELEKYPWLSPVAVEMFGGKYDPATLNFTDNLAANTPGTPLFQVPASDLRDWTAIRAWASSLASKVEARSR